MEMLRKSKGRRPSIRRSDCNAVSMNFFSFTVKRHILANLVSIFLGFFEREGKRGLGFSGLGTERKRETVRVKK